VPRAGPKKVQRYSLEFKLTAVRLSQQPGMQVQAVAAALDIHPFMLSRWRKEVRDGVLRGKRGRSRRVPPAREIARLQELEGRMDSLADTVRREQQEKEHLKTSLQRLEAEREEVRSRVDALLEEVARAEGALKERH